MLTTLAIVDQVYAILYAEDFTNLHKHSKPLDTKQDEYIVINAVTTDAEQLQECQINVNYHCKDLDEVKRIPDIVKLQIGTAALVAELDNYYDSTIDISLIFQSGVIQVEGLPEHFINMRFIVRNIN